MIGEKKKKMRKRHETRRVNEARAMISRLREYSSGKI